MTTDTLFTLRMFPTQSEEQARELIAQGDATNGALELRVVPVDADGQVTAVASPEEATRVLIDLRVLPAQAAGHATPGTGPEPPSKVVQICPGVALRLPLADPAPGDGQDVEGYLMMQAGAFMFGVALGAGIGGAAWAAYESTQEKVPAHKTQH